MAVARKHTVSTAEWVELLIAANVTDASRWPQGTEHGAELLRRIREIERACLQRHGRWDSALLGEALEDEYEEACAELSELRHELDPEPSIPFWRSTA